MMVKPRMSLILRLALGGFLLLVAASLRAQEAPSEPPRFLIEKISVEGTREAAARIIRAEALLREGQPYTEDELRRAVDRVHRLPFVLDATFSLRKGSERGAYELVIQAQQASWFFYDHSFRIFRFDEPLTLEGTNRAGGNSSAVSLPGLIGARLFVGRSGVVFGSLDLHEGAQAGYTQYDLFGQGILASLSYWGFAGGVQEAIPYGLEPSFVIWTWDRSEKLSFHLAAPLGGNHSLQLDWSRRDGEAGRRAEILDTFFTGWYVHGPGEFGDRSTDRSALTYQRAELKWVYDTSDDPLLPTCGLTLTAGLERSSLKTGTLLLDHFGLIFTPPEAKPSYEADLVTAAATATRHWSLTPRQTVSATGRVSVGRSSVHNLLDDDGVPMDAELDVFGGSAGVRHSLDLWRPRGERGFADLRLETGVELGLETSSPDLGLRQAPVPLERLQLSAGLVFRNRFGRVRLTYTYLDLGEVFP